MIRKAPQNLNLPGLALTLAAALGPVFADRRADAAGRQVAPPEAAPKRVADGVPPGAAANQARFDGILRMLKGGAFEQAAGVCRLVLAEEPSSDRAAALLGIALSKSKKYEEARPQLVRARDSKQEFPERTHAAHFLGWCQFHLGELDEAKRSFEAHLASVPGEPDSTFGLGLVALGEDRLDDADALLAKALQGFTEPRARPADQARVLVRMGDIALRRDDPTKAESLYERAAQASPLLPETWAKLARVRDRLGMHEKAEAARANEARILEALGRRAAPTAEKGAPAEGSPEKTPEKTPENSTEKPVDPPAAAKPVETPADAPKAPNAAGAPKEVAP
jgi:tetratricopeptide (TPR) repeat protein